MSEAEAFLKDLWSRCFTPDARHDPDARARGDEAWRQQRPKHLPRTMELLRSHGNVALEYGSRHQAESGKRTLLLMAGYSPEQIALAIATHFLSGCQAVVPFTGRGVWSAVQAEVTSCLDLLDVDCDVLADAVEVDPANPADVFRRLVAWIRKHRDARCAIECTGGKKPMDSGAVHAASFYELPAYYLDFDGYDAALRRPFPWTCVYRQLPLPDAAFGLENRQRVREAFRGRRFGDASLVMGDVVRHADQSGFLDAGEIGDLHRAGVLVAEAAAWMDLRYGELSGHPLAELFRRSGEIDPRVLVEDLLTPDRFDSLFCYLADEYWRLRLLFDAGDVREALVGLVGLAELAIDAMIRAPWFSGVRVTGARAVEWLGIDDPPDLPMLKWNNRPLPVGCLPPSSFSAKVKLLRRGSSTFAVWAWPTENGAELREPPPGFNDKRLAVEVDVQISPPATAPLADASNRMWKTYFGNFPQGGWVHNRHALVHLRAPLLSENAREGAQQALDVFVPRLMEALRRVHCGEPLNGEALDRPEWVRWQQMRPWRRADRAPWDDKLSDLEHWLRLSL